MPRECGYCGLRDPNLEREHVVAACLYPASKSTSRVQRITIAACSSCNRSWADDEAHFRNVILAASNANEAAQEAWRSAVRGFKQVDGPRRLRDVRRLMEPAQIEGAERWMIYPARDDRVLRVVRKVVRGLSYFHGNGLVLNDAEVWVDVLRFRLPDELLNSVQFFHREPDVFQYWFETYEDGELRSMWYLKFFDRVTFIASVARFPSTAESPA